MNRLALGGRAPPIATQMMALLMGGLVAAQAATFAMSTLLPVAPQAYTLATIAAALRGGSLRPRGLPPLQRAVQLDAPDPRSPGWQVSEEARHQLAGLLQTNPGNVELLFYSPPPFAGGDGRHPVVALSAPDLLMALLAPTAQAQPAASAMGSGGIGPGGAAPGGMGGPPGGGWSRADDAGGPTGRSGSGPFGRSESASNHGGGRSGGDVNGAPAGGQVFDPPVAPVPSGAPDAPSGRIGGPGPPFSGGGSSPAAGGAAPGGRGGPGAPGSLGSPSVMHAADWPRPSPAAQASGPLAPASAQVVDPAITFARPSQAVPRAHPYNPRPSAAAKDVPSMVMAISAALPTAIGGSHRAILGSGTLQVISPPVSRSFFGAARPSMVDGEFLAALRGADGRWTTVRPLQDPVLSRWQRRLALWFLAAFAVVAPLAWWMSRRLAQPLATLAAVADRLGRDASTPVPLTAGAPEIRRLAAALAGMQARLQRHVEDRTAMVGAISHDLRTPLARMRFKLERAPPALQASLLRDMAHMQEMLDAVLLFIRDASGPAPREIADLRSIVECVVDDAALVGGEASLEPGAAAAVDVDITGVQRVLTNLVENALKYGGRADVSLRIEGLDVVVEVHDAGPGLPPDEIAQVFQPFYRSEAGRQASAKGIGLGLSVSRSIARAHGGEVTLRNVQIGLMAELRLPLALAQARPTANPRFASAA